MSNKIISPITLSENVTIIENVATSIIIERYQRFKNLDVARHFKGIDIISICQCNDTGFRFYHPLSTAGDDLFYQELQEKQQYYRTNRTEHRRTLKYINTDAKVLEIGTGTGFFLELLKEKTSNCVGLELNTKAVEVARSNGFDVHKELIEEHAETHSNIYDVVCSYQVLEHVAGVKSYIENSVKVLKKGGIMIIGVPNNNPFMHRYDKFDTMNMPPHHVGLWDKKAFESLPKFISGIELKAIEIEDVVAYGEYAAAIVKQYLGYTIGDYAMQLFLTKPVHKLLEIVMKPFLKGAEGRNILAIYEKI